MATGTVKWFNPTKGYGFIQPQGGGKDVFVHVSAVEKAGLNTLNEGQTVQYEVVSNRGKEPQPTRSSCIGMNARLHGWNCRGGSGFAFEDLVTEVPVCSPGPRLASMTSLSVCLG